VQSKTWKLLAKKYWKDLKNFVERISISLKICISADVQNVKYR